MSEPIATVAFVESDATVVFVEPDPLLADPDDMTERSSTRITRKLGATEPPVVFACLDGSAQPVDLTAITSAVVRLRLADRLNADPIEHDLEIPAPTDGRLELELVAADFEAGVYVAGEYDVVVVLSDGLTTQIYPQGGTLRLRFEEALA